MHKKSMQLPILAFAIVGVYVLNFSVRYGKRYFHEAIITITFFFCSLFILFYTFFIFYLLIMFFKNMIMRLSHPKIIIKIKSSCYQYQSAQIVANLPPLAYRRCSLQRHLLYTYGKTHLEVSFTLRCFQRLSIPHIATLRCNWRYNRYTIGASIPVLSYQEQISSIFLRPRRIGTELSHDVLNPARVPL